KELDVRVGRFVCGNDGNTSQGRSNTRKISGKLETTTDNLNQITGKIREGEGTVGKLVQSEETHKNLNDALVAVKEGVAGLNKALGAAERMKIDLGIRSEYLSSTGKGKSYFTLEVDPTDSPRFYRVELSTQPFARRTSPNTTVT